MTKFWRGLWATLRTRTRPAMAWPHEWNPEVDEIARKEKHLKIIRKRFKKWFKDKDDNEESRRLSLWWLIYYGENIADYRGNAK